jgi:hypothetical protein
MSAVKRGLLGIVALWLFAAASPVWEGRGVVADAGTLPEHGFYIATSAFADGTVVSVYNIETNRAISAIVKNDSGAVGIIALLSSDAASSVGLAPGVRARLRLTPAPVQKTASVRAARASAPAPSNPSNKAAKPNAPARVAAGVSAVPSEKPITEAPPVPPAETDADFTAVPEPAPPALPDAPSDKRLSMKKAENRLPPITAVRLPNENKAEPIDTNADESPAAMVAYDSALPADAMAQPATSVTPAPPAIVSVLPAEAFAPPAESTPPAPPAKAIAPQPTAEPTLPSSARVSALSAPATPVVVPMPPLVAAPTRVRLTPDTSAELTLPPDAEVPAVAPLNSPAHRLQHITSLARGKYYVQVGMFLSTEDIDKEMERFTIKMPLVVQREDGVLKLLAGPMNEGESNALLERLRRAGYDSVLPRHRS